MPQEQSVQSSGHVSTITVDWPSPNYVNPSRLAELADALEELDSSENCRVVVLQSNGRSFCGGADPAGIRRDATGTPADADRSTTNPLYTEAVRLYATRKPIVVAVQGATVGAGLGLALIGDLRVGAREAWFAANFVTLGFTPGFGLTHTLPRLIGRQRATEMFVTGSRVHAADALTMGLLDRVVDSANLREAALSIATDIAGNAPLAVREIRATMRGDLAGDVERHAVGEWRAQRRLIHTADFTEGVRAATTRRPPIFFGR